MSSDDELRVAASMWRLRGVLVLGCLAAAALPVRTQDLNDYNQFDNPVVLPLLTQLLYSKVSNLTTSLGYEINNRSSFCIRNPTRDLNNAFNFSSNLDFLSNCIKQTQGDIGQRLCSVAELKFYFSYLFQASASSNYLKPNQNCNLSTWISGCEPGWACSIGAGQQVDLENAADIPPRIDNCQACCPGFFCPFGLTCMIPCPLGAYCPLSTLNVTTGICEPYTYQLPQGRPNHTCGGANIWADVGRSKEMFCSSGSHCPTTTDEIACDSGHFCRLGSSSQQSCYKLVSCNANSVNQNIQFYGILLIAALTTFLLIIYNCSDQLLAIRSRRLAKTRETAARKAHETAKARQRWKAAKDAAKRHANGFQSQLSERFSRKIDLNDPERVQMMSLDSSGSSDRSVRPDGKKDSIELMRRMHEIEDEFDSAEASGSQPKKKKEKAQKVKDMDTNTRIFEYAYAQLEKEKALEVKNKNLTFSGVLSKATNPELKKRPLIEVSFKDLTLTLKAKKKHLLRCVTGSLKPGRIAAVMGPSGAGKTSFLSALAGKTVGCSTTGLILINGKQDSIRSYRKITGFVPQDDIVHGNLTVEENLWFSAKCRLPAHMPRADKVLVVERVINSLGLQSVRDSLVGTVEKRGISGGQRKRVNVGLEMVMEPSLLILDEPTSGLDSASSQLLLRALRHESLEGVTICMVVHQPSYSLYMMFDDLILLAKGGLIVYHGSAKKAEDYFAGLGIIVPERVNPPDHFIDVLEGIVKPSTSSSVSYKDLPVLWMIHNGYMIPPDMRDDAKAFLSSGEGVIGMNTYLSPGTEDQSFVGEIWQDVRTHVQMHQDKIRLNLFSSKDLSNRKTPNVFQQYRHFVGRVGKQRLRDARIQAVDYIILLLAGACLGALAKGGDESFGATGYTYTIIAVSLLCQIAALRSFSQEKLQYWRESASGISSLAYFLAKDTIDHFNTVIKPVVYLSMFYGFTNPRSTFADNYVVLLCLVYCVTGIAYALAIFFEAGAAQLWSVLLPVILTLIATRSNSSGISKIIANFTYPKWALQAFVIANVERYDGVWLITRCGALQTRGFDVNNWGTGICILIFTDECQMAAINSTSEFR
ncbi:hypothetical protein MLD38_008646 [Melastoma candidum]|uniref:Uncharacterized protein n=1 Tax=Melastoma candidum TaxID=119954 RepID=A0ACB9RV67_9MYRT|nr:hypothetical protein MLD38_008646 [Melastoma candidum]